MSYAFWTALCVQSHIDDRLGREQFEVVHLVHESSILSASLTPGATNEETDCINGCNDSHVLWYRSRASCRSRSEGARNLRASHFVPDSGRPEADAGDGCLSVEVLKAGGVSESDIATLDEEGERALIVRLPGRKPGRPILFSAHMDVVDARREEWERSPFELIEENGDFYGRGTLDNKAGVVALVSTILRFKAEKMQPARELVFAFVGDEETGMDSTRQIAAHPWVRNAEFAINTDAGGGILDETSGKPLIYLVQGAEKTYATFDIIVTNPGGHSSRPRGDNAIYQLAHRSRRSRHIAFR